MNLEYLELITNELRILPPSITQCVSLKILLLGDNHLIRLPSELGRLPNLKRLDVIGNHLHQIPFTLGYCETLETILITDNPIVDPPYEEFNKGITSLKWYLRSRYLIEARGMPPLMTFHQIGIQDQVTILIPEFTDIVSNYIDASKRQGLLNLQLLGLRELPEPILNMKDLKLEKLKLDFNDKLQILDGFPNEFKQLTALSMRACQMHYLPDNIHIFEKLVTLAVHENKFESIPKGITELRTLTFLDLSNNHIYDLPEGFHKLKALKTLNLESNNIEVIPNMIYKLTELKTLNLSKNRIYDVPDMISQLTSLKVLNLEKNRLRFIPSNFSRMNLIDLKIGHNFIEYLSDDLFMSNLGIYLFI